MKMKAGHLGFTAPELDELISGDCELFDEYAG
jgi:hypothetical protein